MNTRTLLISGASILFGLSVAGSSLAAAERPEPREVGTVERTTDRVERQSTDKVDRASADNSHDVADKADHAGADKSHDTADKPEPQSGS